MHLRSRVGQRISIAFWMPRLSWRPRHCTLGGPKTSQDGPKTDRDHPEKAPRGPQENPGTAQGRKPHNLRGPGLGGEGVKGGEE